MRRVHAIEIHDQSWCPAAIRDGATDYLEWIAHVRHAYRNLIPRFPPAFWRTRTRRVIDLGAGRGGPWRRLARELAAFDGRPLEVWLTDLHPHAQARQRPDGRPAPAAGMPPEAQVVSVDRPVDATRVPPDLRGFRTLFTCFHHFTPDQARGILQNAVDDREGIAIAEQTSRSVGALALMLVLPLLTWIALPFVRPFRWSRVLWTLIPVIPFVLLFDGIVSCLRTYTVEELREMVASLQLPQGLEQYAWDIGRVPSPLSPVPVTYLIGYPILPRALPRPQEAAFDLA